MSPISTVVLLAALIIIPASVYLHLVARRVGLPKEKEHWVIFGLVAGTTAVWGISKENVWILLVGLLLAFSALIHRAYRVNQVLKKNSDEKSRLTKR